MSLDHPLRTGAHSCALGIPILFALLAPGCLVDVDDRCGEHQQYQAEEAKCVCEAGYALVDGACLICGDNQVGSAEGCVCAEGFGRATTDAACEALAGLGQDCASDAECGEERYPYCRLEPDAAAGYCTSSDCDGGEDCPTDFGCNTRSVPSFCEKPPSGLGRACSASSECADYTAGYCETVVAHSCVVNDCAPDPSKCHGDWVCCDIGLLGQSLCLPPSELMDGNCPAGGTLVPRAE